MFPKRRIKTLLIEDSLFMRKLITEIISTDHEIELVGTASDGREGSALALALKPDVVITDMVMLEYDGMYVVRSLMRYQPVPIILLSALEKNNPKIFDALQHGAYDFIDKPASMDRVTIDNYHLINLIKQAYDAHIMLKRVEHL